MTNLVVFTDRFIMALRSRWTGIIQLGFSYRSVFEMHFWILVTIQSFPFCAGFHFHDRGGNGIQRAGQGTARHGHAAGGFWTMLATLRSDPGDEGT